MRLWCCLMHAASIMTLCLPVLPSGRVAGEMQMPRPDMRLSPAAVSHGKLTVRIAENSRVTQPLPFSNGRTAVTPSSNIAADEEKAHVALLGNGASLSKIVDALNLLGVTPSDLVAILEALKEAGALKAEMVLNKAQIHEAAQKFEALFLRQVLAETRKSNFGDSMFN
ncbi:hypothetical protein KXX25_008947, partial [Aspergillus fumigatus]